VRPIEVAATLGYTVPNNKLFTQEEIKEIRDSNISLRMNVISHSINVNQDGSATIDIQYTARINNTARDKIFSAIDNPIDLLRRADIRQMFSPQKKKLDSTDKKDDSASKRSTRKSQIQKSIEIRKIMDILEKNKKIHYIDTEPSALRDYTELGVSQDLQKERLASNLASSLSGAPAGNLLGAKAQELEKMIDDLDNSKRRIYYVTFGDVVEAFFEKTRASLEDSVLTMQKASQIPSHASILTKSEIEGLSITLGVSKEDMPGLLAIAKKSPDEKKKVIKTINGAIKKLSTFKILLPDIEYKAYKQPENEESTIRVNVSNIPIALETYQEFMYDKIVNSYRNTYTIPQFLNGCINDLLPNVFGKNWSSVGIASKIISAQPSFTSTTYSGPKLRGALQTQTDISPEKVPSGQKDFRSASIQDENDYFVIYQKLDRELTPDGSGELDKDSREGIYHFLLGKNRGLIKEISFSRFDVPFAQEQLMTNQVGLYDELKMPYNANITMVGNNLFTPGSQIFINPNNIGFGSPTDLNSPAFRIGLGGYYTVLTVSTSFTGEGSLTTTLECSFGSHASESEGLSNASPKPPLLGQIDRSQTSNDDVEGDIQDLSTTLVEVSQGHYLPQLVDLTHPESGERIVDEVTANRIANDYILHQDSNIVYIPGVIDKHINPQTGGVRYNLNRGEIIEIDDSRPTQEAVRLVSAERFPTRPSSGGR
jgi:hypothetical protein